MMNTTNMASRMSPRLHPRHRSGIMLADSHSASTPTAASPSPYSQALQEARAETLSKRGRNTAPFQHQYPHHNGAAMRSRSRNMASDCDRPAAPALTWAMSHRAAVTSVPLQCPRRCRRRFRPCPRTSTRRLHVHSSHRARAASARQTRQSRLLHGHGPAVTQTSPCLSSGPRTSTSV